MTLVMNKLRPSFISRKFKIHNLKLRYIWGAQVPELILFFLPILHSSLISLIFNVSKFQFLFTLDFSYFYSVWFIVKNWSLQMNLLFLEVLVPLMFCLRIFKFIQYYVLPFFNLLLFVYFYFLILYCGMILHLLN